MTGPFAEDSIVMGLETGRPERYLRFEPDGLDEDRWLHRADQFDGGLDREAIVEQYALPEAETYRVSVVEVPGGETLRMGSVAQLHGREGGGDLVTLAIRETVPGDWVVEETTLAALIG
ncbi:hypothetical protein ACFQMA_17810 [Halosimplex aquaticum]|uniref:DUF35 domain-containing protein n=1 Tax=Halosimplex aquaticum TaxID=3026162 RepID=A0ABD5Y7A7_9EURY|nr:hypothetical protein [Halosimplex aquaticum]